MADVDVSRDVYGFPGPAIDVEAIERELSNLWRLPALAGVREIEGVPSRTSVLNLVVYAVSPAATERVTEVVTDLAAQHPSRVLIFAVSDDAGDFQGSLDARVTAHCHAETADRYAACFEQVVIATPKDALDYLPSIVAPLVIPDLPTFVWWPGQPPLHDRRFLRFVRGVDRLIIDSLEFTHCPTNLVRTADLCQRVGDECCISDLSWARLTSWREMTAQAFDVPQFQWVLDSVDRLSLAYGRARGAADNPAQALLFVGWVANRLGWQLEHAERWQADGWAFTARRPGARHVTIQLRPVPAPRALNGYLTMAAVSGSDGRRHGRFEAVRDGADRTIHLTAHADDRPLIDHTVYAAPAGVASLLVQELKTLHHDPMYEAALEESRHYAEMIRRRGAL